MKSLNCYKTASGNQAFNLELNLVMKVHLKRYKTASGNQAFNAVMAILIVEYFSE